MSLIEIQYISQYVPNALINILFDRFINISIMHFQYISNILELLNSEPILNDTHPSDQIPAGGEEHPACAGFPLPQYKLSKR